MLGLVVVPLLSVLVSVLGWRLPVVLPVVATLGFGVPGVSRIGVLLVV